MRLVVLLLVMFGLWPADALGQSVYKCVDDRGTTVFSERPCADDPAKMESVDTARALKTGTAPPEPIPESAKGAFLLGSLERCSRESDAVTARANVELAKIDRDMLAPGLDPVAVADLKVRRAETAERAPVEAMEAYKACVAKIDEMLRANN